MNNIEWKSPHLEKDEEFMFLIQPSSLASFEKLQESLLDDGCTTPIIVWHGLIVDGHKRYDICRRWNIPFSIRQAKVSMRSEVYYYICSEQLKRDDLTKEMRKYLIGRAYQAEIEKNTDTYIRSNEQKDSQSHPFVPPKAYNKQEISRAVGYTFHIAPGTVLKYDTYAKIINGLREKDPSLVGKILSGKIRISHENIVELNRLPAHEVRALNQSITENKVTHINYSEIRHGFQWKYAFRPKQETKTKKQNEESIAQIKQMPAYDPDSSLASINLTAPSWINIIDHARIDTDFLAASDVIKDKTLTKLEMLKTAIEELEEKIKEAKANG